MADGAEQVAAMLLEEDDLGGRPTTGAGTGRSA